MAMRRWSVFAVLLLVLLGVVGTTYAENGISVTSTHGMWSKYLLGDGTIADEDPVLQTTITLRHDSGVYVGMFHSIGLDESGPNSDFGDEINWTLGWSRRYGDFGLDFGLRYLDLHPLLTGARGDWLQSYSELSYQIIVPGNRFIPFMRVEYSMPLADGRMFEDGSVRLIGGVSHRMDFGPIIGVDHRMALVYDDGPGALSAAGVFQYQAGFFWQPIQFMSIEFPNVKISLPFTKVRDGRGFEYIYGSVVTLRF